ncbi:DUF3017 domain-containing protein [Streptomyces sp. NPDC048389]|uniref:DUF3017 domain-containing protein n=1 Tax=Streptomyces sp. NPDC048389 TaxID=3154622 RepID=UPI0034566EF9
MEVRTDSGGAAHGASAADRRPGPEPAPGPGEGAAGAGVGAGSAAAGDGEVPGADRPDAADAAPAAGDGEVAAGSADAAASDKSAVGASGASGGEPREADDDPSVRPSGSRRPPAVTRDTARPEGGGRAASGDAPAPARQWPLLSVLCLVGAGLLLIGSDMFADAVRVGTILIGAGLLLGAVLRRATPSVGMLAVRSRFTDMITYGLLGTVIVLLALVAQPKPWLDVPFLENAVHFTVR